MASEIGGIHVKIGADNQELVDKLNQSKTEISKIGSSVSSLSGNIGELKARYRELANTSLVGKSPQEVKSLEAEMAKLKDAIGDYQSRIKSMSLDPFQKAAQATQVISSMLAGAAGAASLFGGEQERLNELMQKTVALVAIANAAQQAADFTRQNAIGIYIKDKATEIALRIKEALTINTVTAAHVAEGAAVGNVSLLKRTAIALQKAWNVAVASNPIMLLVAAVAALAAGIGYMVSHLGRAIEESNSLNTSIDGTRYATVEAVNAHNQHVWALQELSDEYDVITGKLTEYERALRSLQREKEKELVKAKQEIDTKLKDETGFWDKVWVATKAAFIGINRAVADKNEKIQTLMDEHRQKVLEIEEVYNAKERNLQAAEAERKRKDKERELEDIKKTYQQAWDAIERDEEELFEKVRSQKVSVGISLDEDIFAEFADDLDNRVFPLLEQKGVELSDTLNSALESGMENLAGSLAESVGLLAAGQVNLSGVFRTIGMAVADFADSLGKGLIAAGIASEAFKRLLSNPIAAIAAGTALIAAAAFVRAKLKAGPGGSASIPTGGGGATQSIGGGGGSDDKRSESVWMTRNVALRPAAITVTGELRANGTELVAVIDSESKRKGW